MVFKKTVLMPVDMDDVELPEKEFLMKVKEFGVVEYEVDLQSNDLWFWTGKLGERNCFTFQIKYDKIRQYVIDFMGKEATPDGVRAVDDLLKLDNGVLKIGNAIRKPMLDRAMGRKNGQ